MGIPNVPTLLYLCMYVPLIFMAIHRLWNESYIFRRVVNALMVWRNPIIVVGVSKIIGSGRQVNEPAQDVKTPLPAARRGTGTSTG